MTTIAISDKTKERMLKTFKVITHKTGRYSMDEILILILDEIDNIHNSPDAKTYMNDNIISDLKQLVDKYE